MHHWTYAFRFLLCSLRMEPSPFLDENAALNALRHTHALANQRQDNHIYSLANLMEAVIQLGTGAAGVELAKKALMRARLRRFADTPQIEILCEIVDTLCSVLVGNAPESEVKVKSLHVLLDEKAGWAGWAAKGDFVVPVNSSKQGKRPETLTFRWIPKGDVHILGWYLGGLSRFHSNGVDRRAEKCLHEGLNLIE